MRIAVGEINMADGLPSATVDESYAFFEGTVTVFLLLFCFVVVKSEVVSFALKVFHSEVCIIHTV